ncbi:MAG: hypothetical protein IBX39_02440 [Candidatus Methanoperedenaceae archaeon]|nr:hypothetical protein [Candidatus Methanoperedenaceae archaeon]
MNQVIRNNQNGRGASIEKVVSEAVKIGMNGEQAISYIEHLKSNGYAYEPVNGEINLPFDVGILNVKLP